MNTKHYERIAICMRYIRERMQSLEIEIVYLTANCNDFKKRAKEREDKKKILNNNE